MRFILKLCETIEDEQNRLIKQLSKKIEENNLSLHVKDSEICELKCKIMSHSKALDELKSLESSTHEGTFRVEIENMEENLEENVEIHPKVDKYITLNGLKW